MMNKRIPLTLTSTKPPSDKQQFALISIITPKKVEKLDRRMFKIYGVFETQEEATKYIETIKSTEDTDIFLASVGEWLYFEDDINNAKDIIYREKELNEIMHEYNKQREEADKMEKTRQQEIIKDADKQERIQLLQNSNNPEDKIKLSIEEKLEIINKEEKLEAEKNIDNADKTLDNIKALYDKLK